MYHQASVLQGHQLHLWPWLALPPTPAAPFVSHWSLNASAYTCHNRQSQEVSWDEVGHGNPVISKLRLEQKKKKNQTTPWEKFQFSEHWSLDTLHLSTSGVHWGCLTQDTEEAYKGTHSESSLPETVHTPGVSGLPGDGWVFISEKKTQALLQGPLRNDSAYESHLAQTSGAKEVTLLERSTAAQGSQQSWGGEGWR